MERAPAAAPAAAGGVAAAGRSSAGATPPEAAAAGDGAASELCVYVLSPHDIVVASARDADDKVARDGSSNGISIRSSSSSSRSGSNMISPAHHRLHATTHQVSWLLARGKVDRALELAIAEQPLLRQHKLLEIVELSVDLRPEARATPRRTPGTWCIRTWRIGTQCTGTREEGRGWLTA